MDRDIRGLMTPSLDACRVNPEQRATTDHASDVNAYVFFVAKGGRISIVR